MTEKDLETYIRHFPNWASTKSFKRILVVNPDSMQEPLVRGLFPGAEVVGLRYPSVDLSRPIDEHGKFDMVFIANTLMCAQDPGTWLNNVLGCCEEVWIQELIRAQRNGDLELSPESGDVSRFSFSERGELSRVPGYEIDADARFYVERIVFYSDTPSTGPCDCRKFIAIVRKEIDARATGSRDERKADPQSHGGKKDRGGRGPSGGTPISF
jgi:hypothetical protein